MKTRYVRYNYALVVGKCYKNKHVSYSVYKDSVFCIPILLVSAVLQTTHCSLIQV